MKAHSKLVVFIVAVFSAATVGGTAWATVPSGGVPDAAGGLAGARPLGSLPISPIVGAGGLENQLAKVALNPQPIPPGLVAVVIGLEGVLGMVALNPQRIPRGLSALLGNVLRGAAPAAPSIVTQASAAGWLVR